jgi:cytochrome P450 PksS
MVWEIWFFRAGLFDFFTLPDEERVGWLSDRAGRSSDKVMAMLAAANMDPAANAHPERLDLQRKPNRHIAFGTGIHFCLGNQLARIEARCALKSLFRGRPELAPAVDPSDIKWRKRPGLRAIDRLPARAS